MTGTYGLTAWKQFAYYDPDTHSLKMFPDTGLWGSIEYSQIVPPKGSMSGGQVFEHRTSAHPTSGNGCSSSSKYLPTPTTSDVNGAGAHGEGAHDLRTAVSHLPTPTHADGVKERNNPSQARRKSPPLSAVQHMLPTPTATHIDREPQDVMRREVMGGGGNLDLSSITTTDLMTRQRRSMTSDDSPTLFDDGLN